MAPMSDNFLFLLVKVKAMPILTNRLTRLVFYVVVLE